MKGPLLSIIIPSYNQLEGLKKSLNFLSTNASRDKFELIVVDGGSTDGSKDEILRHSNTIDHTLIAPDKGIYDAMNKGVAIATGSWCWFLGTGDLPDEKGLKEALKALEHASAKENDSDIYAFSVKLLPPLEPGVPELYIPDWSSKLKWRNTMHHQGMFYPTSVIKDLGYELRFKVLSDYHLNLKLWVMENKCVCSETIVAHVDAGGVSRRFNSALYREEIQMKEDLGIGGQIVWTRLKHLFKTLARLTS